MKSLAQQLSAYAAYHRNPWNRVSHCVGVPLIVFSLLVPLSWLEMPAPASGVTAAQLFVVIVLVYYIALDALLAAVVLAFIAPLLYAAAGVAEQLSLAHGAMVALAAFIGGWLVQLGGHAIEGRRPAFVDNFLQLFIAPIFLVAELIFALGLRGELRDAVWGRAAPPRDARR